MAEGLAPDQLKLLMDSAAGWADGWDDVLWYLQGPAAADTHLPEDAVRAATDAVLAAKRAGVRYSGDYRRLWTRVTGQPAEDLPGPEIRSAPTDPIELKETYLAGLTFPAERDDVLVHAEGRGAPWRVLQALEDLAPGTYADMDALLDAIGDIAWNPRRERSEAR